MFVGKFIRFIMSLVVAGIAFLIGTAVVATFSLTAVLALVLPVILAIAAFSIMQLILGIFKIKNLIFIVVVSIILEFLGFGLFNIFA